MKNKEILLVADAVSNEKGVDREVIFQAIELALENNYGIKIVDNNKEIAKNNASLLNSGYLPTVTGTSGATYNRDNLEAEFSNGETTELNGAKSNRYNAALNVNYTLFDGLGRYYDYKRLKEERSHGNSCIASTGSF